jgi:hypothetical protein
VLGSHWLMHDCMHDYERSLSQCAPIAVLQGCNTAVQLQPGYSTTQLTAAAAALHQQPATPLQPVCRR